MYQAAPSVPSPKLPFPEPLRSCVGSTKHEQRPHGELDVRLIPIDSCGEKWLPCLPAMTGNVSLNTTYHGDN